jgi:TonB family protein
MAPRMTKRWRIDTPALQAGMILRISLIISFFLHIVLLITFQKAFPIHWVSEDLRTYRVELIRPPVETLDTTGRPDAQLTEAPQQETPAPEESQDTISLDTQDKRYITYAAAIKERISANWVYPEAAKDRLIEGRLTVLFSLSPRGELMETTFLSGSGYRVLDEEAARAIRSAAPFPSFPAHITVNRLNVKATFDYRITSRR